MCKKTKTKNQKKKNSKIWLTYAAQIKLTFGSTFKYIYIYNIYIYIYIYIYIAVIGFGNKNVVAPKY